MQGMFILRVLMLRWLCACIMLEQSMVPVSWLGHGSAYTRPLNSTMLSDALLVLLVLHRLEWTSVCLMERGC